MYKIIIFALTVLLFITFPAPADSAVILYDHLPISEFVQINENPKDIRIQKLESYLSKFNSPLTEYSSYFIRYADEYQIDWRLVPAIAGVESTFGKRIPYNSYNAYGWNNGNYSFQSWEDSIEHVTKTIRIKYVDDGLNTVDKIGRRYCPPNPGWAWKVKYFMHKIDPYPIEFNLI